MAYCKLTFSATISSANEEFPFFLAETETHPEYKSFTHVMWLSLTKRNTWSRCKKKKKDNCLSLCRSVRDVGQTERDKQVRPPCVAKLV